MDVAIESGAEAVEECDGAELGLCGWRCVPVTPRAGRVAKEALDLAEEDRGECRDGLGAVGEEAAESLGHRDHPLADGHGRDDAVDEVRRRLRHAAAVAGRADATALALEADQKPRAARRAAGAGEAEAKDAAAQIRSKLLLDVPRDGLIGSVAGGEPGLEVRCDDPVERRLVGPAGLVALGPPSR
jgi:hypothetical protein